MSLAPNTLSMRERIMAHLQARFQGMTAGQTITLFDGRTTTMNTTWNSVSRKPLTKQQLQFLPVVALFDTAETKQPEMQFQRVHLTVIVEFFAQGQIGGEPSTILNAMLMDVQHTMLVDINCGGLTLDVREVKNELSVDGPGDNLLGGMVQYTVVYRHRVASPRLPM